MKRFKFRLERVLQLRDAVRAEKERELQEASARLHQAEDDHAQMVALFNGSRLGEEVMEASQVFLIGSFLEGQKERIKKQEELIQELERKREEAREAYGQAAAEAEALHSLKRKRLEEYDEYLRKEETKMLDELAIQKGNTVRQQD